jgi:hypothetical protein
MQIETRIEITGGAAMYVAFLNGIKCPANSIPPKPPPHRSAARSIACNSSTK